MKLKNIYRVVVETYKDFARNTSIHGLKYTGQDDVNIYEKFFWASTTIFGLCSAGYMTVLFWSRYNSNPTRTTILDAHAPTAIVPFPAVTICNTNSILATKVDEFINHLDLRGEDVTIIRRAMPQLIALTEGGSLNINMTDLGTLEKVLSNNGYNDPKVIMGKIGQSCSEMMRKCYWEYREVDCLSIFEESLVMSGICCSFNYVFTSRRTPYYNLQTGPHSGLTVLIDPMTQPVQYSSSIINGVEVFLHNPGNFPGSEAISKIIAVGMESHIQVTGSKLICSSDVRRLDIENRKCLFSWEKPSRMFKTYSDNNCEEEEISEYYFRSCGCVPFYYSFSDRPKCTISQIPCFQKLVESSDLPLRQADCAPQCEEIYYNVLSSVIKLESLNSLTSDYVTVEDVNQTLLLRIFFIKYQTVLLRDTITSTIYLLSSFGGIYGLFIGCSFLTVFEIIYYCLMRFSINLGLFGRVAPLKRREKKEETILYQINLERRQQFYDRQGLFLH